jgi:hypothetical protein
MRYEKYKRTYLSVTYIDWTTYLFERKNVGLYAIGERLYFIRLMSVK